MRVGSMDPVQVDVRVIAATNRPLLALVREGKFREDLFYRLNVVEIVIPPLRERTADLPLLFDHFLEKYSRKLSKKLAVAPGLLEVLSNYSWPGNVRELENTVERAVTLNHTGLLATDDLPAEIVTYTPPSPTDPDKALLSLEEMEAQYIKRVIDAAGGNMSRTAEILKVDRRTLYRMIDRYGLWSERLTDASN